MMPFLPRTAETLALVTLQKINRNEVKSPTKNVNTVGPHHLLWNDDTLWIKECASALSLLNTQSTIRQLLGEGSTHKQVARVDSKKSYFNCSNF